MIMLYHSSDKKLKNCLEVDFRLCGKVYKNKLSK